FVFQAEDGIRDFHVTGVQTCALPILSRNGAGFSIYRRRGTARTGAAKRGAPARYAGRLHRRRFERDRPLPPLFGRTVCEYDRRRSEERRVGKRVSGGWPLSDQMKAAA